MGDIVGGEFACPSCGKQFAWRDKGIPLDPATTIDEGQRFLVFDLKPHGRTNAKSP